MTSKAFKSAYKNLNKEQKKAVDTIEGPVMVIAGPGTGKTSILTLRIANILAKTDTPANGVLALTFTESAVNSMRRKLAALIGSQAYRVPIYTFHGFANEIIRRYPQYFPRIIGGTVATDVERLSLIEKIIAESRFSIIKPFGEVLYYVRPAMRALSDLKRDNVSPDSFESLLAKEEKTILESGDLKHENGRFKGEMKSAYKEALKNIEKNRELAVLYSRYEKALARSNLYDYDDMLLELVRALKEEKDLLRTLQEEYLYILADEHQDANNAQNAILELLASFFESPDLFIVGDEKQAIYRFQGASMENFLYFQKKFPKAEVIFLAGNYRSTQTILDASHALMSLSLPHSTLLRPRLVSTRTNKKNERAISLTQYETAADEIEGVAHDVKLSIETGIAPEDIAVLTRTNAELQSLGRALGGFGVPYALSTHDDVLSDEDIAKLIILLTAITHPRDDEAMGKIFLIDFLGIHPVDAITLLRAASRERVSPLDILTSKLKDKLPLKHPKAVEELSQRFSDWMLSVNNKTALDAFLDIVTQTQFTEYLLAKKNSLEKIGKLGAIYEEVKSLLVNRKGARLSDFVDSIETLKRHEVPITFPAHGISTHAVSVMTAHKSKGLEFRIVYIVNVVDKIWGNRRGQARFKLPYPLGSTEDGDRNEDERRLFYVALTRAKEHVSTSYSRIGADGRELVASQFVEELPADLVNKQTGAGFPATERLLRATKAVTDKERTIWDRKYLRKVFLEQGLNATALNNYLTCPWQYFFRNLVRLPDVPEKHQLYGIAVHTTLKAMGDSLKKGTSMSEKEILNVYMKALHKEPLGKHEFEESLKKGKSILSLYSEKVYPSWNSNLFVEYPVNGVYMQLGREEILLRGRLDKIEFLDGSNVRVVDYKTGKPKTRNEITGETKNSNGDIKRQLNFYRLLLDLQDKAKYTMTEGLVDFVEPDDKGRFHGELFTMTAEDSERVKNEALKTAKEILEFSFWDKHCDNPKCEYCKLRDVLISK